MRRSRTSARCPTTGGAGTRRPSWWRRPRPHGTPAPISSSSWPTRTIGPRSSTAASASTSSATTRSSSYRGVRDPGARRPRAREALRPHGRPRRGRPRGRRGRARRATRTERRRQVDARQDRLRACPAVARDGRDLWRSRRHPRRAASARLPRRALPLSRLVLGRRGARAAPAALGLRGRRIGAARAARARRAERRPRPPRRADVEGHAAAPGDRAGAGRLAAAPAPGRADARARSGRRAGGGGWCGGGGRRGVGLRGEERQGRGTSVLLNSHLLSEVELVCDRVVILLGGSVVAEGSPAELGRARGVEVETDHGTTVFEGKTREDIPALVAELVAAGRKVYGVRVLTSTLEETYLEAVGEEQS